MTATIEVNERLLKKAEKYSGITDESKLLQMVLKRYVKGVEFSAEMLKAKAAIGDENPFFDGYDPKA
jgi:hypothetical protein